MNKPLRVLIVEDSEDDALLLLRELRRSYEPVYKRVETLESLKAALESEEWDLIISDYVLPRFSGHAALSALKESGLDLPFIIVSGNIGEDIAVEAMKAGAHDYIIKGSLKRLVPAVERELREAEVRRQRRRSAEELQVERNKLKGILDAMEDGVYIVSRQYGIEYANPAVEKEFGSSGGRKCYEYFYERSQVCPWCRNDEVFAGKKAAWEWHSQKTGKTYNLFDTPIGNSDGSSSKLVILRDITQRKETENRIIANNEILKLFSQTYSRKDYLDAVVELIRKWSGCRCVGIRILDEHSNIPYDSYVGFSREFWQSENFLSLENDRCVCTRVIAGKPEEHEAPVMTPHGSFCSNNSLEFVEGLSEEQRREYRGECFRRGYKSLAVIPVRYREKTIGAIHLADEREGKVPLKVIEFVELIAPLIGEALYRFSMEDQLRRNYEALRRSEEGLSEAQRIARLGNWDWDLETNELHWSDEIYKIFGLSPRQFDRTYITFLNHVHPEDRESVRGVIKDAILNKKPYNIEYKIVMPEGAVKMVQAQGDIKFNASGEPVRMVGTIQDITERKKAEEELASSREQLRNLSLYLQSAREAERTNIAREIHDELGQVLTALKMDLSWLESRMQSGEKPLVEKTKSMSELVDLTIQTVKRILSELRPGVLDHLGLVAAMEWQAEEFEKRTGIACKVKFDPEDITLDKDRSTTIFRIFQEALTNVIRHSEAGTVRASLEEKGGGIVMTVQDNGKGITDQEISNPQSFGLLGMQERVHYWGGTVHIEGIPHKGTTLTVSIPLEDKDRDLSAEEQGNGARE